MSRGPRSDAPPRIAYTVPEVARALGISRSSAYDLVTRGDIPSTRLGGRIFVPVRALEALLATAS